MHVHIPDIHHATSADGLPRRPYPITRNVPVNQNVEVRIAVLLEFKNSDVLRSGSKLAFQIDAKHPENTIQIFDRIAIDLGGV
jgi:hypothetical protein